MPRFGRRGVPEPVGHRDARVMGCMESGPSDRTAVRDSLPGGCENNAGQVAIAGRRGRSFGTARTLYASTVEARQRGRWGRCPGQGCVGTRRSAGHKGKPGALGTGGDQKGPSSTRAAGRRMVSGPRRGWCGVAVAAFQGPNRRIFRGQRVWGRTRPINGPSRRAWRQHPNPGH